MYLPDTFVVLTWCIPLTLFIDIHNISRRAKGIGSMTSIRSKVFITISNYSSCQITKHIFSCRFLNLNIPTWQIYVILSYAECQVWITPPHALDDDCSRAAHIRVQFCFFGRFFYVYSWRTYNREIIILHLVLSSTPGRGRGYWTNFYTGRLRPEVQPLALLYTIFHEKGIPFVYLPWVPLSHTLFATLHPF